MYTRKTHRSTFFWQPCDRKNTPVVLFPRYLKIYVPLSVPLIMPKSDFNSFAKLIWGQTWNNEVHFDYVQSNILHLIVLLTCFDPCFFLKTWYHTKSHGT